MGAERAVGRKRRAFVVLFHERSGSEAHYDLLLQSADVEGTAGGGLCLTWSFAEPPGRGAVHCRRIFDHPSRFLTYEGPLRPGQGQVSRYDAGTCSVAGAPETGLLVTFRGRKLAGRFRLTPVSEGRAVATAKEHPGEGEYLWQPAEDEPTPPK